MRIRFVEILDWMQVSIVELGTCGICNDPEIFIDPLRATISENSAWTNLLFVKVGRQIKYTMVYEELWPRYFSGKSFWHLQYTTAVCDSLVF